MKVKNRKGSPALPAPEPIPVFLPYEEKGAGFCSSTPEKAGEDTLLKAELRELVNDSYMDDSVLGKDVSIIASPAHLDWKLQPCMRTPQQSTPAMKLRRLSVSKSVRGHDSPLKLGAMDKIPQRHLGAAFDALSESKNNSLNSSVCSNLSVSSMSPRQFCHAITRAGQPCRNKASGGQEFCRVHSSGQSSYIVAS